MKILQQDHGQTEHFVFVILKKVLADFLLFEAGQTKCLDYLLKDASALVSTQVFSTFIITRRLRTM